MGIANVEEPVIQGILRYLNESTLITNHLLERVQKTTDHLFGATPKEPGGIGTNSLVRSEGKLYLARSAAEELHKKICTLNCRVAELEDKLGLVDTSAVQQASR